MSMPEQVVTSGGPEDLTLRVDQSKTTYVLSQREHTKHNGGEAEVAMEFTMNPIEARSEDALDSLVPSGASPLGAVVVD